MPDHDSAPIVCPDCAADTVTVCEHASAMAVAWYLRCTSCGQVWTMPKSIDAGRPRVRLPVRTWDIESRRNQRS